MKMNTDRSSDLVQQLVISAREGLFQRCDDPSHELRSQYNSLARLHSKASSADANARFLATYDSVMRLVEIRLLSCGFRLGRQPHQGMIATVEALLPQMRRNDIKEVVNARHGLKKSGITPSGEAFSLLAKIHDDLAPQVTPESGGAARDSLDSP